MVRAARLPRTVKRRPQTKAVLLALADRCNNDGFDAFPAVPTIAAECEIGTRTADACLATLRGHGLIAEQSPPRQHRPRTWRLNLDAILALAPGSQHVAGLDRVERPVSDPQHHVPDPQIQTSDPQNLSSGSQHVADDPVLLNRPLNQKSTGDGAPDDSRQVNTPTFGTLCRLCEDVIKNAAPSDGRPDYVEDMKKACLETFGHYDPPEIHKVVDAVLMRQRVRSPHRGDRDASGLSQVAAGGGR